MTLLAQSDPNQAQDTIEELTRLTAADWIIAGTIILASLVVGVIVRTIVERSLTSRAGRLVSRLVGRLVLGVFLAIGFVYALNQVGVSMGPLLGLLGILGLALALALQEVLANFIAGVMLSVRRPFRVGDEIATADFYGVVEDVSLRFVAMRTFDGVRVYLPNSTVWDGPIENYTTLGSRRSMIGIGVSYASDLDAVKVAIEDSVASVAGVRESPSPAAMVEAFGESSIDFSVFYWHDPTVATEWRVRDVVARVLKRDLDAAGVEIPFPQLVIRRSPAEH